ncbi:hypothetical protein J6590_088513 [Homalodisca vitripennis]|nr:hypothetical protein J6590_088513 [Homalodisca vitripennis]
MAYKTLRNKIQQEKKLLHSTTPSIRKHSSDTPRRNLVSDTLMVGVMEEREEYEDWRKIMGVMAKREEYEDWR